MTRSFAPLRLNRSLRYGAIAFASFIGSAAIAASFPTLPEDAEQTAHITSAIGTHALPIAAWQNGKVPTLALVGHIEHQSWRLPGMGGSTFEQMQALTAQLAAMGFKTIFSCDTLACGGFDFRYETKVLSEPEMHVDLGDFRFLSAIRGVGDSAEYVGLLVSRAGETGFVQLNQIRPQADTTIAAAPAPTDTDAEVAPPPPATAAPPSGTLAATLEAVGSIALDDLSFASGASELEAGDYASLAALAEFLKANPDRKIIVVGHTDASGSLDANIALSRRRAQSVVDQLIADNGADPAQISADGVGFLSPRATNLTDEGRHKNRRVEAVLASTL
ncbi:MAG: OmpA family protein [Albidovulum sp.]